MFLEQMVKRGNAKKDMYQKLQMEKLFQKFHLILMLQI